MPKGFILERLDCTTDVQVGPNGRIDQLVNIDAYLLAEDKSGRYEAKVSLTPSEYEMLKAFKNAIQNRVDKEFGGDATQ